MADTPEQPEFFESALAETREEKLLRMYRLTPESEFYPTEVAVGNILTEAGRTGLLVNPSILRSEMQSVQDRLNSLQEEINDLASRSVKVGSAADLTKLLFEELGLSPLKLSRKKKRPSFSKDVLAKYEHPVARAISAWKSTRSTLSFLEKMSTFVGPDSRIRTEFLPWDCPTGRIYCRDFNLQQIPVPGRKAIVPDPGTTFVYGDFSSVELRILYALSKEYDFYNQLMTSDIHSVVASQVLHKPLEEVTEDDRKVAKVVSYGISYGVFPASLAFTLNITEHQAQEYIDEFYRSHAGISAFLEDCRREGRLLGTARTMFGHVRDLAGNMDAGSRERMAMNTPIQGACAGYLKKSIVAVSTRFAESIPTSKFLMTVHDSILMQVPTDRVEEARTLLEDCMHHQLPNSAPNGLTLEITAVIKAGNSWAEVAHGEQLGIEYGE